MQHAKIIDDNNIEDMDTWYEPIPDLGLKVSKACYQYENNILAIEVDQEYKNRAQRNCSNLLFQNISANKGIKFWTQSLNLASVSIFTFTIILLC